MHPALAVPFCVTVERHGAPAIGVCAAMGLALGAARTRILRQLMTESLVLAAIAWRAIPETLPPAQR